MKNQYLYTNSFQSLLWGLKLKEEGKKLNILSSNDSVIQVVKKLDIKYIQLPRINRQKFYILKSYQIKKTINEILYQIKEGIIHFSHPQWDLFCFIFIRYASINTNFKIKFCDFELHYPVQPFSLKISYIYYWLLKRFIKIIYNVRLVIKSFNKKNMLGIDNTFLCNHNIEHVVIGKNYFHQILPAIAKNQIKEGSIRNLFLDQNLINYNRKDLLSSVEKVLVDKDVLIKAHPNGTNNFPACEEYKTIYPVELILKNITNNVISFYSNALVAASNFKQVKAVSLIELLIESNYNKIATLNEIKKHLIKMSNNRILFPKNLEEFDQLII